ncbi:hypothetical protein UlMin_041440 [Ulmus minor]
MIKKSIFCIICDCYITAGPYYVCDKCKYYIHESCYALPHQIDHSFHPSHALTLYLRNGYWCGSCHKHFEDALSYRCDEDDFDMDIECARMPPMTCEGQTHIQHFSHQHPMPLLELGGEIQCFACQSTSSGAFYGCTKCEYFLHKSCAELPTNYEFRHPFHSDHGLYQLCVQHKPFCCSSCKQKTKYTFVFKCIFCDFMMCVKCHNKTPIKYKYHEHLLHLTEPCKYLDRCNAYDGYCQSSVVSKELDATKYHVFECSDCSFVVHLPCGPLPRIIKHENHLHSLSLAPSIIEDTSGEYYCDFCETERDPRVRFYHCEECKYTAHIRCVILEVLNVLNGDLKDVELKVVREDLWENEIGKEEGLTVFDVIFGEASGIENYYIWESTMNLDSHSTSHFKVEDEDIDEAIKFSRSSENDFKSFMEDISELNRKRRPIEVPNNFKLKVVNVEGYKIPLTLAPVMRTLLHKYGDVSGSWVTAKEEKSFTYSILCEVLKEMSSTIVEDVTKNMICDWYYHLSFLEFAKFKIDFVLEHLKGLTHAFVGRQAKRVEDEIPTKLRRQITKLEEEIAEKKAKLEICEKFGTSSKSRFLEEGLNKASEWKWKRAHQGLF